MIDSRCVVTWAAAFAVLLCAWAGQAGWAQQAAEAAQQQDEQVAEATAMPVVGWLELSGPLRDGPVPFAWVSEAEAGPSLRTVVEQIETIAREDQYLGVVLYLDWPELTLTQVNTIADALAKARAAGKKVLTFSEAYDLKTYLLASEADLILLQHKGAVELSGLAVEEMYLAGLLEKVGAKADMIQVGQYKGAQDPLTRAEPSEAWNENMDQLLDDLYNQIVSRIADGRQMPVEQVEKLIGESWSMSDEDYLGNRLVDRLTDRSLVDVTQIEFGDQFVWDDQIGHVTAARQQAENPFALFSMLFKEPTIHTRRPTIAVLHASGPITSGESTIGDGAFSDDSIGSRTLVQVLGDLDADPNVKGVVLRIDSPGGSALASEIIWQAVRELGESKPVYASVNNLAASGGYYIACAADEIFVSPESIVGSIGVVGGKIILGGLYEKLGINIHRRTRGPLADMFNSVEPFTPEQRKIVRGSMLRVYEQFTDRVTIGRGNRLTDIDKVAQGRLFTGKRAVTLGMADQQGSLDDTIVAMADQLQLLEGSYDVVSYPGPLSLGEFLGSIFGAKSSVVQTQASPWLQLARQAVGQDRWPAVHRALAGLMLLQHEPTLTLMPYAITVK